MSYFLGIDVGGTASRWSVVDDSGALVDRGIADGATGLIYDATNLARFVGMLESVRDALPGPVSFAELGITGAGFSRHMVVEEQVSRVLGLPLEAFHYSNDTTLAWNAVFEGRHGHLVSAGTGSVGITFDQSGQRLIVGGYGVMVDDGGSGVWIALRAIERLFRRIDEEGRPRGAEILASAVFEAMGGGDREALRGFVYGRDRGRLGALAVPVAEAAREGCPMAQELLTQAGHELARLGQVMIDRAGAGPVAFVGGVLALDPSIRRAIEDRLTGVPLEFPRIDAALQAAQMARGKARAVA